jgi:predicted ATPase/class 3 adenylate cyclase
MTHLPTGTVTFYFSDIEGSTRLLEALGDRYPALLDRHREIVRDAFGRFGAVEVSTQGDSFFAAVPDAARAVAASVAIQRGMAREAWGPLPRQAEWSGVRIRIGLHTGDGRVAADDYVGLDVHRAARIMSAAHGGQIVASATTRSQARQELDADIALRDLGEHRLKDLSAPERLYQVVADGLGAEFPPLRTLDRTPNNLPTQPSPLIGRERELAQIRSLLDAGRTRLITLTGPGGIGKTRLALQAAADQIDRVDHGVYLVDLAAAGDTESALQEIARVLHVPAPAGADLRAALAAQIAERNLLLVLDNFEQVIEAADAVADLLRVCPRLFVLATSREALRVRGEQLVPIEPLAVPELRSGSRTRSAADVGRVEAVRLFLERATESRPDFELTDENASVVAEICARLDGLPLAIELAAARLRLFSVTELRDRLGSRLDVLRGGARDLPQRQRTLRDAIEWSHDLLDADERALFAALSVFESARIEAVEQVAARLPWLERVDVVDRLGSLVDKSLVRSVAEGGRQRLSMLGVIRDYAAEGLAEDRDRLAAARTAHAEAYLAFAVERQERLRGPDRLAVLDELAGELGNLLAAWSFFLEARDGSSLNGLLEALWPLHEARGWYQGALRLTRDLLALMASSPPRPEQAEKEITLRLSAARTLLAMSGYTGEVEQLYNEALVLAESAGLPRRLPVLRSLSSLYLYRGEIDKSLHIGQKLLALAEQEQDDALFVEAYVVLGPATAFLGQLEQGIAYLDRASALFDPDRHGATRFRLGPSPGVVANAVGGLLNWAAGRPDVADQRAQRALEIAARLDHPYSRAYALFHVAYLDSWQGRLEATQARARATIAIAEAHEYLIWKALGTILDGVTIAALGDPEAGLERCELGVSLYSEIPTPPVFWPQLLALRAIPRALAGRPHEAIELLDEAIRLSGTSWDTGPIQVQKGRLLVRLGDLAGGEALYELALGLGRTAGAIAIERGAAAALAELPGAAGERGRALLRELGGVAPERAASVPS